MQDFNTLLKCMPAFFDVPRGAIIGQDGLLVTISRKFLAFVQQLAKHESLPLFASRMQRLCQVLRDTKIRIRTITAASAVPAHVPSASAMGPTTPAAQATALISFLNLPQELPYLTLWYVCKRYAVVSSGYTVSLHYKPSRTLLRQDLSITYHI